MLTTTESETRETILAGTPTSVDGFVHYENETGKPVDVTQVTIRDADGDEAVIDVDPVTVGPGRTARIAVRFALNPQTAPGSYPLEAVVAGVIIPVTAHIAATQETGISPTVLVIDNVPKASSTETVVVANNGNVAVFVADFGQVPLYREDAALTTLLAISTRTAATGVPNVEALPEPAGTLDVSTGSGRVEIRPGEIAAVGLDITVPADLDQTTRYLAALPISVRTLLVTLVPSGPENPRD